MTTRLEMAHTDASVPLCLMLTDDEDRNIRMMFEHPPRLAGPRHRHAPERRRALATVGSLAAALLGAAFLALRKGLA